MEAASVNDAAHYMENSLVQIDPVELEARKKAIVEKILARQNLKITPKKIVIPQDDSTKKLMYMAAPALVIPFLLKRFKLLGSAAGAFGGLSIFEILRKLKNEGKGTY